MLAETRRQAIADRLRSAGSVTIGEVQELFEVSPMTARRDLAELEKRGLLERTHGGAVLPSPSSHEDSFARRLRTAAEAKGRLADAAMEAVRPHDSVFLDSSTTSYFVARRIVSVGLPLTVLTNSLPIAELVFEQGSDGQTLIALGGTLRRLTRSFVGPATVTAIRAHFADRLVFSVKGIAGDGTLTDADPLEAEVKRAMLAQAGESLLLVDDAKLSARGLSAVAGVDAVDVVLADGFDAGAAARLEAAGAQRIERVA